MNEQALNQMRPRILFIASSWPDPEGFGGQLRSCHVGRALKDVGDVSLLVASSEAWDKKAREIATREFEVLDPVLPQPALNNGWLKRLRWALDVRYLNVHGYEALPEDRARLQRLIESFDLVWVMNARTPNILGIWKWPHSHLDMDDVPSTFLRSVSRGSNDRQEQRKARIQQLLFRHREQTFHERFTTLSVCSEEDKTYLGGSERIHVIPNGFQGPSGEPLRHLDANEPRVGFIGLYSYGPNRDGVEWFLRECWPALRLRVPGIRFRLAGKGTGEGEHFQEQGVDVLGWLPDPADEIATWSAMAIPIRFGGGTRIKLVDAFSRKCPVVATRVGAFGYDVTDGVHLRIADSADDFVTACVEAVSRPESAAGMADRAHAAFLEKWTWDAITPCVCTAAEDNLRRNFRAPRNGERQKGSCSCAVVIPTWNRAHLLERAILSALGQTNPPAQVIVVDDGSTDNTAEICRKFGDRIEYVYQQNSGVSAARNHGIRLCRQPWTAFLDSDDYWTATHLERVAAAIEGTSGIAAFYFTDLQHSGYLSKDTVWNCGGFSVNGAFELKEDGVEWMLARLQPCYVQASVFNTGILKLAGGFEPRLCAFEDAELFCRLGIGRAVCAVNTIGCIQTADDEAENRLTGVVNSRTERYWSQAIFVSASVLERFPQLPDPQRRHIRRDLSVGHWRLTRLLCRSGRILPGAVSFLRSAMYSPSFVGQLLYQRKSSPRQNVVLSSRPQDAA